MYAWFVKESSPATVMMKLFANPRCNLHEFWRMGHNQLYFRHCINGGPLCGDPGTLVCDNPFDSFLFGKKHPQAGKPQFSWKPFTIAIDGVGKADGMAWMGIHVQLENKLKINVPNFKELHARKILQAV